MISNRQKNEHMPAFTNFSIFIPSKKRMSFISKSVHMYILSCVSSGNFYSVQARVSISGALCIMLLHWLFSFFYGDSVGWQSQCAFPSDPYGRKNSENGGQQNLPSSWLMFPTTQFEEQICSF